MKIKRVKINNLKSVRMSRHAKPQSLQLLLIWNGAISKETILFLNYPTSANLPATFFPCFSFLLSTIFVFFCFIVMLVLFFWFLKLLLENKFDYLFDISIMSVVASTYKGLS